MSATATVRRITRTRKWDEARTEIDVVELDYDGGAYFWESLPAEYGTGQKVNVNPPASLGANITPA